MVIVSHTICDITEKNKSYVKIEHFVSHLSHNGDLHILPCIIPVAYNLYGRSSTLTAIIFLHYRVNYES